MLVQWYNKLKQTVLEVEFPLIRAELVTIDMQLYRAETDLTWKDQDCWAYIRATKDVVHSLERRVQKTKDNCDTIQTMMKGWSKQAMFCRKDNKRDTLILLEDRGDRVNRRYSTIQRNGHTIHKLVEVSTVP